MPCGLAYTVEIDDLLIPPEARFVLGVADGLSMHRLCRLFLPTSHHNTHQPCHGDFEFVVASMLRTKGRYRLGLMEHADGEMGH